MCRGLLSKGVAIVFDLDDTLYEEEDFVASGFAAAARVVDLANHTAVFERLTRLRADREGDPFGRVIAEFGARVDKNKLVAAYRDHKPDLCLADTTRRLLERLKSQGVPLGLLTDGRSLTQRNKLAALGLADFFDEVVVSEELGTEKPAEANYRRFETAFPGLRCVYVGDNLAKDFVTPNRLDWATVGVLDRGRNIHPQAIEQTPAGYRPQYWVRGVA